MGNTFRILSIDGGGIRGIYPAHVLHCIEKRLHINLFDTFDMTAGTSTGSIIAAGVATCVPAADIVSMYKKHGARIFQKKRFFWPGKKLKNMFQPMFGSVKEDFINIAEMLDEEHYMRSLVSPVNKSSSLIVAQSKALSFNVAHRQKPYWALCLNYSVKISAKYKANASWQGFNSGEPLNKLCDLLFSANTNIPAPFQVYWQVVNTGKEAEDARQLRGEIFLSKTAGIGGLTQKEHTSYTGIHWIECFIVKNGVCVARSGEFIVRIV